MLNGTRTGRTLSNDRRQEVICYALGVLILLLALQIGVRATQGHTWGAYVDFDRDASFARGVQEGHYGEDPLYRGESLWFTPLVFTFEALASNALGMDIHAFQARAGAYLNLLVPIAFWFMARRLFGPWVGVAALLAHVCLMQGQEPGWAVPTYSPWFLPMIFCQCLFYLSLPLLVRTLDLDTPQAWAIMGAAAGLLFLGHAAPAILMVLLIAVRTVSSAAGAVREGKMRTALHHAANGAIAGGCFILITLPLTWYVVGDYMLDQKNRVPSAYTYAPLSLRHAELFLFHNLNWVNALALVGTVRLWRMPTTNAVWLMRAWITLSILLLLYAYAAVALGDKAGIKLPMSVPTFHFYFYLKASLAIGFGLGLWAVIDRSMKLLGPVFTSRTVQTHIAVVCTIFFLVFPSYANRSDIALVRHRASERSANITAADMRDRLVELVPWEGVVLCDEELSMEVLMAAARKTVATAASMANPYVAPDIRNTRRDELMEGLQRSDGDLSALLDEHMVSYLLVRTGPMESSPGRVRWFPHVLHRNKAYVLYMRSRAPSRP